MSNFSFFVVGRLKVIFAMCVALVVSFVNFYEDLLQKSNKYQKENCEIAEEIFIIQITPMAESKR